MKPKFGDMKLWWEVGKAQYQVVCQLYTSRFTAKLRMMVEELEASIKDNEMGIHTDSDPTSGYHSRRRGWS